MPSKRGSGVHRLAGIYDPQADMAATQAREAVQSARCADGEHDVRVAQKGYRTYICGRLVQPGTRYCHSCAAVLASDPAGVPATAPSQNVERWGGTFSRRLT